MSDNLHEWIAERERIQTAAKDAEWEHGQVTSATDPWEIYSAGTLILSIPRKAIRNSWAPAAIVDAHNHAPTLHRMIEVVLELAEDFDTNGNSRGLGDPSADTWHKAASLIREKLKEAVIGDES